jgi:hypothetical protein
VEQGEIQGDTQRHADCGPAGGGFERDRAQLEQDAGHGRSADEVRSDASQRSQKRDLQRGRELIHQLQRRQVQPEGHRGQRTKHRGTAENGERAQHQAQREQQGHGLDRKALRSGR